MSDITVVLRNEVGLRVPGITQVPVEAGSHITFKADADADSVLYFSPQTVTILSPNPGASAKLPSGQSVTYAFTQAGPGSYEVITQAPESPAPKFFDVGAPSNPPVLAIRPGSDLAFPGPINPPGTLE